MTEPSTQPPETQPPRAAARDSMTRTILKILLPLVVLGIGAGVAAFLVETKPETTKTDNKSEGVLVEVTEVSSGTHDVRVHAQGTVIPAKRVQLQSQVGGRVRWQHEQLVPGGKLDEGERILKIDASDYSLAVESNRAQVARAQLELELEESRQQIAEREWKLFGDEDEARAATAAESADAGADGGQGSGRALALREPQVQTAEVGVESARSALKKSKLDLSRTTLTAPFNAMVVEENVDRGQVVGPGVPIATIVGTDHFWVQVAVPIEALGAMRIPGVRGAAERAAGGTATSTAEGSKAEVWQTSGEHRIEREGRVVRLLPDLDPGGSMARILVAIEDPLGLDPETGAELPMLLNSYVHVEVDASPIEDAIEIPRVALRDGGAVYVMNDDSRLEMREVRIAWRHEKTVLVGEGLEPGDRVITSPLASPVDGMLLRVDDGNGGGKPVAKADGAKGDERAEARP